MHRVHGPTKCPPLVTLPLCHNTICTICIAFCASKYHYSFGRTKRNAYDAPNPYGVVVQKESNAWRGLMDPWTWCILFGVPLSLTVPGSEFTLPSYEFKVLLNVSSLLSESGFFFFSLDFLKYTGSKSEQKYYLVFKVTSCGCIPFRVLSSMWEFNSSEFLVLG